ncbi:ASAH2 [Mytilus edulis]|uniref:Neutral ceramidase n=2 Tax=Mytilus edulis TaxID=6550 RepID=A0A8S3U2D0_MYTED|nr:ASAH2 [Mytilus edulis]
MMASCFGEDLDCISLCKKMMYAYVVLLFAATVCCNADANYIIGTGISDITGPAAEVDMMGYANPAQTTHGIHLRQYSRAFIISDIKNSSRIVFVNTDSCMQSQGLKLEIVKRLKSKYGNLYTERNLCISGTHTHSGPGGFHQYLLYDITSLGFVKESFDALVEGIIMSIDRAHSNQKPGNIYVNSGELLESNINRSPTSYLYNPPEERARYKHDVDKNMTVLKLVDAEEKDIGMISWFAVHCTSMNNTNHLISSDNKGYAEQLFEMNKNGGAFPSFANGKFVAAFAQANEGDVSPNTAGPRCLDTGKPCDSPHSTCNGRNEMCVAFGPGKDMFDSTKIIAENQYKKALELYDSAKTMLTGPVDFRHSYVDMTKVEVQLNATTKVKTCKPAMGYSFAAGTTDGPGAFNFEQGSNSTNPFWNLISSFLKAPTAEQIACHKPKPILLDTGEMSSPYMWEPEIVDVQLLRIGQLALIAVPAEFTTMSGRRTRDAVKKTLVMNGFPADTIPVIAGLSNDYADYVATFEEYQAQRYEAGSTIFGPHTLEAYIQQFEILAEAMAKGTPAAPGPNPPNLLDKQLSFLLPVVFDHAPFGSHYGDVVVDAKPSYKQGDSVVVKFIGANPRNDRKWENTFLTVDMLGPGQNWTTVYTDGQWPTKFEWHSTSMFLGESQATITWDIPADQQIGTYRIQYFGNWKEISGSITTFHGKTKQFKVTSLKDFYKRKLQKSSLKEKIRQNMALTNDILASKFQIPQNVG